MSQKNIIIDRESTHGPYELQADIATEIVSAMNGDYCFFCDLPNQHQHALTMIATKLSRIITGDHNHEDHWVDIQGYCERVLELLREKGGKDE